MIDFDNSSVFKLKPIDVSKVRDDFHKFLIDGETIFAAFKTVRDQVVFTNKRVIAANVQGITVQKWITRRCLTARSMHSLLRLPARLISIAKLSFS